MAIDAGDSGCTTGLSKAIYDAWTGDTSRNGMIGNTPPSDWHDMVRSTAYAIAAQVAAAHNSDAITLKESFGTPLASDVSTTSTTYANVSGLSFPVAAGDVVAFEFWLPCTTTDATMAAVGVALTGPASPGLVTMSYETFDSSGASVVLPAGGYGTLAPSTSQGATVAPHRLRGLLRNGASAGTVQLQYANTLANGKTVTIKAGAFVRYAKVN